MGWLGDKLGLDNPMRSSEYGTVDPYGDLRGQSQNAGFFANFGERGYGAMTQEMDKDRQALRALQSGQNSVSAEQLRQGLQQNLQAQRSLAASASPANAAMAARTASMNSARLGGGLAGQQALAGIAERNAATTQLAALNQAQRGQDMNVALGSRQNALSGYGALEDASLGRYQADMQVPSKREGLVGALGGALTLKALSDKNQKTDINQADDEADNFMRGLQAYTYKYRNPNTPGAAPGKQLGVMAQDLEKSPMSSGAVVNTPHGKVVDGGHLMTAMAAGMGRLAERLDQVEGKKKKKPVEYEIAASWPHEGPQSVVPLQGGKPGRVKSYEGAPEKPMRQYEIQKSFPAGMVAHLSGGRPGHVKSYEGPIESIPKVTKMTMESRLGDKSMPYSSDPKVRAFEMMQDKLDAARATRPTPSQGLTLEQYFATHPYGIMR